MQRPDPINANRLVRDLNESVDNGLMEGGPGAAPASSEVIGINLDNHEPPARASTRPDGSFALDLPIQPGDHLRAWVEARGLRSTPVDLLALGSKGPFVVVDRNPCLQMVNELVVQTGENTLTARNECATDATVLGAGVRMASPGISLSLSPASIPAGAQAQWTVSITDAGSSADDTLLFDMEIEGRREHRAVSIYEQ